MDGVSGQLKRILEGHGVRTVLRSSTTLRNQLVRPKDPPPPGRRGGVVYEIPCNDCDRVYIGETGRPIGERVKEHQRDVRLSRVDGSAVAEHAWGAGHHPDWDNVRCVDQEHHWYTRRVKEAIHIRLRQRNINRDSGIDIPGFWLPTIRHHDHRHATRAQGIRAGDTPRNTRGVERAMPAVLSHPTSATDGAMSTVVQRSPAEDTPQGTHGAQRTSPARVTRHNYTSAPTGHN